MGRSSVSCCRDLTFKEIEFRIKCDHFELKMSENFRPTSFDPKRIILSGQTFKKFVQCRMTLLFTNRIFFCEESSPSDNKVSGHHSLVRKILGSFLQFIGKCIWHLCYYILAALCAFSFLNRFMSQNCSSERA